MLTESPRPPGCITVDLDSLRHYLRSRSWTPLLQTHLNTVYDHAVPRLLDLFDECAVRASFFVIGEDLEIDLNRRRVSEIAARGHEVASHSYSHASNFCGLPTDQKRRELTRAHERIGEAAGQRVVGFRAPGYSIDLEAVALLEEMGYTYDTSVFPSSLVPAMKLLIFLQRRRSSGIFGRSPFVCLAPPTPYHPHRRHLWRRGDRKIMELPTSVTPLLRFPFWATLLATRRGPLLMRSAYPWLRRARRPLVFVMHGLDAVDYADVQDERLLVKPGLDKPLAAKIRYWSALIATFAADFRLMTAAALARECARQ